VLANGCRYHEGCYAKLINEIDHLRYQVDRQQSEILRLQARLSIARTLLGWLAGILRRKSVDKTAVQSEIAQLENSNADLRGQLQTKTHLLRSIHDFWPDLPPDWETRSREVRDLTAICEKCGRDGPSLQVDHRKAASCGGHTLSNLILLCDRCHKAGLGLCRYPVDVDAEDGRLAKRLALLRRAIVDGSIVRFGYTDRYETRSVRSVRPRGFIRFGSQLCVIAHCYLRNADRHFAVSRMEKVRIVKEGGSSLEKPTR
jgi:5-methylcytosine-specific restriction endonuclease McrA